MRLIKSIIFCITAVAFMACGEEEYFNINGSDNSNVELNGAVDLGLSVKWAACDLGSSLPYISGSEYYGGDFVGHGLKNICGTQFDPATKTLGEKWRMPTRQEMEELLSDCTWSYRVFHNVGGWFITGPSGKTIFLKAEKRWTGTIPSNNFIYALTFGLTSMGGYNDPVPSNVNVELESYSNSFAIRPVME